MNAGQYYTQIHDTGRAINLKCSCDDASSSLSDSKKEIKKY